jgi:hypothetical protein
MINTRVPLIEVDLSAASDIDPESFVMKVSGFGRVPAEFSPATRRFSWQVTRPLRHPVCQVSVGWRDLDGEMVTRPLTWSFQVDLSSEYLQAEAR